ncbi:hypothetical protein ACIHCM_37390 [Streptomyces sp. NPDC052023]|uniref:hypothetical protein n=1 Tax=Streptomyces sp. NPDC052023 TaxID=3365681 RepID=UPI0037D2AB9C
MLTVSYGASFRARVPLSLIEEVAVWRTVSDQQRTAAINEGVLPVPVMSITNLVLKLHEPARLEAGKTVGEVREIRIHATDPTAAVTSVRNALEGNEQAQEQRIARPPAKAPVQVPTWLRRLRWAGLLVLLIEIVLVTTGLLDWRIAAGILVVTEGTLSVLGLVFGVAFISQYRKLRRTGLGRRAALGEAFYSLMPPPIAEMVRHEVSVWGISPGPSPSAPRPGPATPPWAGTTSSCGGACTTARGSPSRPSAGPGRRSSPTTGRPRTDSAYRAGRRAPSNSISVNRSRCPSAWASCGR